MDPDSANQNLLEAATYGDLEKLQVPLFRLGCKTDGTGTQLGLQASLRQGADVAHRGG